MRFSTSTAVFLPLTCCLLEKTMLAMRTLALFPPNGFWNKWENSDLKIFLGKHIISNMVPSTKINPFSYQSVCISKVQLIFENCVVVMGFIFSVAIFNIWNFKRTTSKKDLQSGKSTYEYLLLSKIFFVTKVFVYRKVQLFFATYVS